MDAFEVLGVGRRLEIGGEELRQAFREAGKRVHPDGGGEEDDFAELRQALETLSSPSRRLRHWLELQGITGDERGSLAGRVTEMFGPVGETVQAAEAVIRKRAAAATALGRAMLEAEVHGCRERVEETTAQVEGAIDEQVAGFPAIESAPTAEAYQVVRTLAFLEKWRARLRAIFAELAG